MKLGAPLAVVGLLALHVVSCVPSYLATPTWQVLLRPAPDLALLLAVTMIGALWSRPWTAALIAALLLLLSTIFGSAASLWPLRFDRPFVIADLPHLGGLFHLLFDQRPDWVQWVAYVAIAPLCLAVWWGLGWLLLRVARVGGRRGIMIGLVALQLLVVAAVARQSIGTTGGAIWHRSSLRLLFDEGVRATGHAIDERGADAEDFGSVGLRDAPVDLRGLEGVDVHVVFVESYGRVALRHPRIGAHLRTLYAELGEQLNASGLAVASGACAPAVRGGGSSLAHAEFLVGIPVPDYATAERALRSTLPSIPKRFAEAGYETVSVMPAMDRPYEPLGAFYGYARQLTQVELAYDGFRYHFGRMPDQYAMHHLLRHVIAPATGPIFSCFVSVTSHLPCTHIPPYIADWNIDATTFRRVPETSFDTSWLNVHSSPEAVPAFEAALAYSMRCVVGFASRLERPSLVLVLGDHQPPIKRQLVPDDDSGDVVLHVVTNRPALLESLSSLELVPGLDVPGDFDAFESATFAAAFLRAFSRPQ